MKTGASDATGLLIGVDVGGTKVAAGVVDQNGAILRQTRVPMAATGSASAGLACVISAIRNLGGNRKSLALPDAVQGIGVCAPGPLDPHTGVIINPPNLPCWRDYPLAAQISQTFRLPVRVDNDANAAALAEARWGAGRGYRNVFYATIGTGIGTGIVFDGHIYHGRTGAAAEGGHVSIDYRGPRCACGKPGCIEVLASGPAIARRARAKLAESTAQSSILDLAGGNIADVSSETVAQAFAAGDGVAQELLLETIELLALWLGNMVDLLEPDVIVVGGGVAVMLSPLMENLRERLPACAINPRCREIPVVLARYGADAGIAGGAALCKNLAE
ncbi:MAG TPA: ROK family protein [Terriglobales bacterium]|nr:ROK family protein [Terriglobales bacterium]